MKGYKVFNPDWTCRGFQYEVGKTFEEDVSPKNCERGFHFCTNVADCFNYYSFDTKNKIAEVEALGEVVSENDKCCTNRIKIIREVTWEEMLTLANTGKGNSGNRNSGNYNSGNRNNGYYNSGNRNSGNYNSGNRNSGNRNSGNYNSGNRNSGDYNSGDYNSGDYNSGDYNSGDYNSGYFNKTSYATGCFNIEKQKLKFFDKETNMTLEQWQGSEAFRLMRGIQPYPVVWTCEYEMTTEEKDSHPEYKTIGGYLKKVDNTDTCQKWWNDLSDDNKNIIKQIPNFDAEKFYSITGIDVAK